MDSTTAPSPETPQPPYEAWRRFTLLDLMILFTGHGVAMGIMKWHGAFEHERWSNLLLLWYLPMAFLLGAIFSLPLVLAVQFYSRGRRERIARGELVAVILTCYWSLIFVVFILEPNNILVRLLLFVASSVAIWFVFVGIIMMLVDLFVQSTKSPCLWLCFYGYFLSVASFVEITNLVLFAKA